MKKTVVDSLFKKVAGLQSSNFVKKWHQHRCFPVNVANFLRTAFSREHLRWLLSCLLEREEEEGVNKGARKNFSNERRK